MTPPIRDRSPNTPPTIASAQGVNPPPDLNLPNDFKFHFSHPLQLGRQFLIHLLGLDRNKDGKITSDEVTEDDFRSLDELTRDLEGNSNEERGVLESLRELTSPGNGAGKQLEYFSKSGHFYLKLGNRVISEYQQLDPPSPSLLLPRGTQVKLADKDAGNGYCEHLFFLSLNLASNPESSVYRNKEGEALAAFLHIPRDKFAFKKKGPYTQASRHARTREILGYGIRGYFEEIRKYSSSGKPSGYLWGKPNHTEIGRMFRNFSEEPFRILVTGFGNFEKTVNNPTEDFIKHSENIDESMKIAFGDRLLTKTGELVESTPLPDPFYSRTYKYQVSGSKTQPYFILVQTLVLPVDDRAINKGEGSIQQVVSQFQPDAIISMGMNYPNDSIIIEHSPDSGGVKALGEWSQGAIDSPASPASPVPSNYSFMRALEKAKDLR